jgi:hypothetical protein
MHYKASMDGKEGTVQLHGATDDLCYVFNNTFSCRALYNYTTCRQTDGRTDRQADRCCTLRPTEYRFNAVNAETYDDEARRCWKLISISGSQVLNHASTRFSFAFRI